MDLDEAEYALEESNVKYQKDESSFFVDLVVRSGDYMATLEYSSETGAFSSFQLYMDIEDGSAYESAPEADLDDLDDGDYSSTASDYSNPKKISGVEDFELDGELYSLGAPVSAYIDNGWKLTDGEIVEANDINYAVVEKGDSQLQLFVKNDSNKTISIENAETYEIIARYVDDFKIFYDIEPGDKRKDVKKTIDSEGFSYDETSGSVYFYDGNKYVNVFFDSDTDRVNGFSIGD